MAARRVQASFTVEASFVVPLVFYIIFALLYVGFYLYDMTVLHSRMAESLWEQEVDGAYCFSPSQKKQEQKEIAQRFEEKSRGAFHVLEIENIKVSAETFSFRLEADVRLYSTLPGVKLFLSGPSRRKTVKYKRKRISPTEFARAYKEIGEIISETDGASAAQKRRETGEE